MNNVKIISVLNPKAKFFMSLNKDLIKSNYTIHIRKKMKYEEDTEEVVSPNDYKEMVKEVYTLSLPLRNEIDKAFDIIGYTDPKELIKNRKTLTAPLFKCESLIKSISVDEKEYYSYYRVNLGYTEEESLKVIDRIKDIASKIEITPENEEKFEVCIAHDKYVELKEAHEFAMNIYKEQLEGKTLSLKDTKIVVILNTEDKYKVIKPYIVMLNDKIISYLDDYMLLKVFYGQYII